MSLERRSFVLVVAAPSGAGKTSLARALVERNADIVFSVSATTRAKREYEKSGQDYLFVNNVEFDRMIAAGELVEWATVHDRRYGTPKQTVKESLRAGNVVVLDIDVQGARQIRERFEDAVLVFILPPSAGELERRLTGRGTERRDSMEVRLRNARGELATAPGFDYVVVNDDFERAVATLESIVAAERHRVSHLKNLDTDLQRLDREIAAILERSN